MTPLRVLVPFDDSDSARRALTQLVALAGRGVAVDVHLLNVQPGLPGDVTRFVPGDHLSSYHHDAGMAVLASAQAQLDAAGLPHTPHVGVGPPAPTILHFASTLGVEIIVMGTRGRGAVAELLLGSVASGVLQAAAVPVLLIR